MVETTAEKNNAACISEVEIDIGLVSGIVPDALEFAMEVAIKNTKLENAKIIINTIQGKARCVGCSHEFVIEDLYAMCPNCSGYNFEILQGKEMRVRNITVN